MPGEPNYEAARRLIYAAHDEDPNEHITSEGKEIPYETHYSTKMENFLNKRAPNASDVLKLAICGQHFRRWEVPSWRTFLKKRQGKLVAEILEQNGYSEEDWKRCQSLIEKEGLKQGEDEVQILEDVACLVFLDDQFDNFKDEHNEEKIVNILKKTWGKMSKEGQDMALELPMTDECKELVGRALSG
jgi:hypothetical protein